MFEKQKFMVGEAKTRDASCRWCDLALSFQPPCPDLFYVIVTLIPLTPVQRSLILLECAHRATKSPQISACSKILRLQLDNIVFGCVLAQGMLTAGQNVNIYTTHLLR